MQLKIEGLQAASTAEGTPAEGLQELQAAVHLIQTKLQEQRTPGAATSVQDSISQLQGQLHDLQQQVAAVQQARPRPTSAHKVSAADVSKAVLAELAKQPLAPASSVQQCSETVQRLQAAVADMRLQAAGSEEAHCAINTQHAGTVEAVEALQARVADLESQLPPAFGVTIGSCAASCEEVAAVQGELEAAREELRGSLAAQGGAVQELRERLAQVQRAGAAAAARLILDKGAVHQLRQGMARLQAQVAAGSGGGGLPGDEAQVAAIGKRLQEYQQQASPCQHHC